MRNRLPFWLAVECSEPSGHITENTRMGWNETKRKAMQGPSHRKKDVQGKHLVAADAPWCVFVCVGCMY